MPNVPTLPHGLRVQQLAGIFYAYKFARERHKHNYPTYWIEVPISVRGEGWDELNKTRADILHLKPDDLDEMSIYGVITFEVTKDENLNRPTG